MIDVIVTTTSGRPLTVGELRGALQDQDDAAPVMLIVDKRAAAWLASVEADLATGTLDLRGDSRLTAGGTS